MGEENINKLFAEFENAKYQTKPAKTIRKKISKVLVLNELEEEKAKGMKAELKAVFNFLNSGDPKIPFINNKEELRALFNNTSLLTKIIAIPAFVTFLPVIAIKMGIRTGLLAKIILEKPELVESLKEAGLYDNILKYAEENRINNKDLTDQQYMENIASPKQDDYNTLIEEMNQESKERGTI